MRPNAAVGSSARPRAKIRDFLLMAAAAIIILTVSLGVALGAQRAGRSRGQSSFRNDQGDGFGLPDSPPPFAAGPQMPPVPANDGPDSSTADQSAHAPPSGPGRLLAPPPEDLSHGTVQLCRNSFDSSNIGI